MRGIFFLCCVMAAVATAESQAAPREDFADSTMTVKPTKLWTEPGQFGEATAQLDPGLELEVIAFNTSSDWAKVRTPSGREGWVPVRFTALTGRRSGVLVPGAPARERAPAGAPDELPAEGGSAPRTGAAAPLRQLARPSLASPRQASLHQAGASLEYFQRFTPEAMPGLAIRPHLLFRVADDFWIGPGLDFSFSGQTTTVLANVMASLRQTHTRFAPVAVARRVFGPWRIDAALGLDFERTGLTTTDLTTQAVIGVYNGYRYTGTAWDTALTARVQPAYLFALDATSSLGLTVSWSLRADFSSGQGSFAGAPGSGYSHALGAGLAFNSEF